MKIEKTYDFFGINKERANKIYNEIYKFMCSQENEPGLVLFEFVKNKFKGLEYCYSLCVISHMLGRMYEEEHGNNSNIIIVPTVPFNIHKRRMH